MKPRSTEHGLLMSGPMALAAFRGIKTQTRRPLTPQPKWIPVPAIHQHEKHGFWAWQKSKHNFLDDDECDFSKHCPYGRVGDRIYVRETFAMADGRFSPLASIRYRADAEHQDGVFEWRPSLHLPKWASRTWGTIASVRVERVQSISEADAIAEGVEAHDCDGVTYYGRFNEGHIDPRVEFRRLWDSLYSGELSWTSNPWVWVVEWKKEDKR